MAEEVKQPVEGGTQPTGDVDVIKVSRNVLRSLQISDDDLRAVAEPYQVVVRAQLDANGIRLKIIGNARFGEENDLERDGADGLPTRARSHAGYTVEADEDDARAVADVLASIARKYRARAIGGAMRSAYTTLDPLSLQTTEEQS